MIEKTLDAYTKTEKSEAAKVHQHVRDFLDGESSIRIKNDQQYPDGNQGAQHRNLPDAEALLKQLRIDARTIESAQERFDGDSGKQLFQSMERNIVASEKTINEYSEQDLKRIKDIVAARTNPAKMQELMQVPTTPKDFLNSWIGISLEQERQNRELGLKAPSVELTPAFHTEKNGKVLVPEMEIFDKKTQEAITITGKKLDLTTGGW